MQPSRGKALSRPEAEAVAVGFLSYLAGEPEQFSRFMALTGLDMEDLRAQAADHQFLLALLDYLLSDEALLLTYCGNEHMPPETVERARIALGGRPETDY